MLSFNSLRRLPRVIRQDTGVIGWGFATLALGSVFMGFLAQAPKEGGEVPSVRATGKIIEKTERYVDFGLNDISDDVLQSGEPLFETAETFDVEGTALNPALYRSATPDEARLINASLPFSPIKNARMRPFFSSLSSEADRERALHCLTLAVYFEAASESIAGQRAVAQVVLNRVRHPAWPHTVCGVVFQGSERETGCQFSFTCDGALRRKIAKRPWQIARGVAFLALNGSVMHEVSVSTHYHTDWVAPYWSPSLRKLTKIGTHIFYTWNGASGTPRAFRDVYKGVEDWPKLANLTAPELDPSTLKNLEATFASAQSEEASHGNKGSDSEVESNELQGFESASPDRRHIPKPDSKTITMPQQDGNVVSRTIAPSSVAKEESKSPVMNKF